MASRRRKRPLPARLNNEEQQRLAWNMTDLMKYNDGVSMPSTFHVHDPCSSGLEFGNFSDSINNSHTPKKKQKFMPKSGLNFDQIVDLKLESSLPDHETWHCHIGTFRVNLVPDDKGSENGFFKEPLGTQRNGIVKVTVNLESMIDNEMGSDFITHGNTSPKECLLPSTLRILSMKGLTSVPQETLQAIENLQKKGMITLVIQSKTSVFDDKWDIKVCLRESALTKMKFASQDVMVRSTDRLIQNLMEFFFNGICKTRSDEIICNDDQIEFSSLYETVMKRREENGRMLKRNMNTYVAGYKSSYKYCALDDIHASKPKMNGRILEVDCVQEKQKEPKKDSVNMDTTNDKAVNYHCKIVGLDSRLPNNGEPLHSVKMDVDSHIHVPAMEVPSLESSAHEGTSILNSKVFNDFQHANLKPTLRKYQRKAVQWMVDKENRNVSKSDFSKENDLHFLWKRCVTMDKKVIFFNAYNGRLTTERFTSPVPPPGGILADEMGLGKTVEVLACILNNPKPGHGVHTDHNDINVNTRANDVHVSRVEQLAETAVSLSTPPLTILSNPSMGSPEGVTSQATMVSGTSSLSTSSLTSTCTPSLTSSTASELPSTPSLLFSTPSLPYTTLVPSMPLLPSTPSLPSTTSLSSTPLPSSTPSLPSSTPSLPSSTPSLPSSTPSLPSAPSLPPTPSTPSLLQSTTSLPSTPSVSSSTSFVLSSSVQLVAPFSVQSSSTYTSSVTKPSSLFPPNEELRTPTITSTSATDDSPAHMKNPQQLYESVSLSDVMVNSSSNADVDRLPPSLDNLDPALSIKTNLSDPALSIQSNPVPALSIQDISDAASNIQDNSYPIVNPRRPALAIDDHPYPAITIKCVCGSIQSSIDDVLLKCTECAAASHASCLGHTCSTTDEQLLDAFLCPNCAVNRPPIASRATLIISPVTIAHQWVEEITRHTTPSALRLLVYEGVAKQGFVQPDMLADHDVILTTYATLRADFHHLVTQQGRSLRYQKRYIALPSPLTAIKFWRICLDEAQMVESTTAKAAEMALRLDCVHRWCVTGTPIQKGLEDLYGLLLFLGVLPYCQRVWWKKLLYEPYLRGDREPMHEALADILWRTAKINVLDEIHLPIQTELVVRLNFSPVEEHFYRRQHEECSASILTMLGRFGRSDMKLSTLDRNTVHRMLIPLLRLRQACCHPQAVRGGFLSMQKSTMTMDQLLEVLITRAKLECEEAHRQLMFAINGLAGIHAIKEEWPEAVELYRESMRSWMEHEDKFRTDALQKLHTLHNLTDLLSSTHPGCSRTLRDDKLKEEAEELIKHYMTKPNTQVQAALDNLIVAEKNIEELLKKVESQTPWWLQATDIVESRGLGQELINRVRDELTSVSTENGSILDSFTDLRGLEYTVTTKLDVVESTHDTLVKALDQLRIYPTREMVQATAVCCLRSRPQRASKATRCKFCEVDEIFTEYESRLFGHQGMKGVNEQDDASNTDWHRHGNTGGLRAETETEKVLKTLFAFIKSQRLVPSVHQDARNHLTFMESRRKEFKFLRGAWFALRERVSSLDELEMCTTKLRLAFPGETENEDEKHVIQRGQVDQQKLKFISDRIIARTELRKKLGQYLYLTNLAKSQKFNEGENPDPCPVCTKQLGKEWSVFSCGHCYCCQCVWVLLRQAGIGPRNRDVHIKCPICRLPTLAREISYVCTGKDSNHDNKSVLVKGSHSTKVEAIVRALLKIKAEDNTAKCLVFSTWQDVLELIGKALQENDITFRHITCGGKRFQADLHVFKEDPDVRVLLLPLQTGSNGLNIIEATHVLLVEPALNPAHELQAVGRVHRIGQTRPTYVHRFIINNTVESRMHSLLNGKSKTVVRTGSKDTENADLTIADLTSLFKEENEPLRKLDYC